MNTSASSVLAGRLDNNFIGVKGAKAIAAVLKDSQLSTLGCAATSNLHSPYTRQLPADTAPDALPTGCETTESIMTPSRKSKKPLDAACGFSE